MQTKQYMDLKAAFLFFGASIARAQIQKHFLKNNLRKILSVYVLYLQLDSSII